MSSKIHILLLLIVYAFAPFLHSEGSTSVHPTLRDICNKTSKANLCISTIAPGFNGREADASSALKEAIRVITARFKEARKFADKLAHEPTTSGSLVSTVNLCKEYFDQALDLLPKIPALVDDRSNPDGLNMELSAIGSSADNCLNPMYGGSTEKTPIGPMASGLYQLASICSEISTQLGNSKDDARTCKAKGTSTTAHVDPALRKICKEIIHPDLCVSTVAPLLKGRKADTVSVIRAEIQATASKCNEATQLVDKLVKDGKTPSDLVKALKVCNKVFHSALKDLMATGKAIDGGAREIGHQISVIDDYVKSCEDSLSKINAKDSPVSTVVSDLRKLTDNCYSLYLVMDDPKFAVPAAAATGSSSSSKAKRTTAQVHPTLNNICKKTSKASLCISTIAPGFNGREADASSALKEAIRVITAKFEEARKFADKLAHEPTTSGSLMSTVKLCKENFDSALDILPRIPALVDNRSDPDELNMELGGIRTSANGCLNPMYGGSTEKTLIGPMASELYQLANICSDIGSQINP